MPLTFNGIEGIHDRIHDDFRERFRECISKGFRECISEGFRWGVGWGGFREGALP